MGLNTSFDTSFNFLTHKKRSRNFNLKLYFEYILFNLPHFYLLYQLQFSKITSIFLPQLLIYYTSFHLRFSSVFHNTQLVDIFAYELPNNSLFQNQGSFKTSSHTTVVYNFHNLRNHERLFFFSLGNLESSTLFNLHSISELYSNSSWLEREVAELHGVVFNGQKDLRNLMLQYGDTSTPFQKSFPSIGVKEVFYDSNSDLIIQLPISLQV